MKVFTSGGITVFIAIGDGVEYHTVESALTAMKDELERLDEAGELKPFRMTVAVTPV